MTPDRAPVAAIAALLFAVAACGGSAAPAAQTDVASRATPSCWQHDRPFWGGGRLRDDRKCSNAYFTYINNTQGGVIGRKITYKILTTCTPANTVPLTKQLVEQDQVFAMFGGLGTQAQTSRARLPEQQKVPQLFVATGPRPSCPTSLALLHDWLAAPYQARLRIYAKDVVASHSGAKIGVLYSERRLRPGLSEGTDRWPRIKRVDDVDKQSYDVTAASVASQLFHPQGQRR